MAGRVPKYMLEMRKCKVRLEALVKASKVVHVGDMASLMKFFNEVQRAENFLRGK